MRSFDRKNTSTTTHTTQRPRSDTPQTDKPGSDPAAEKQQLEADYHRALRTIVAHMLLSNSQTEFADIARAREICSSLTGQELGSEDILADIQAVRELRESLSNTLARLREFLDEKGREDVITAASQVAMFDGSFEDREQSLLFIIGRELGMADSHVTGILNRKLLASA